MKTSMTQDLARAAGMDTADRNMRQAGRTEWSEEDWNDAVAEYDRLWPLEKTLYQDPNADDLHR